MDQSVTDKINAFTQALEAANPAQGIAIILIGSVARGTATPSSDLDLLVLSADRLNRVGATDGLHVQMFTAPDFLGRLGGGDDFAGWCVRYGIPVVDHALWQEVIHSPQASTWPDWRAKINHLARRLLLAADLLKLTDVDAAKEELLYAVSHVGRALLLKQGVFPLSRPEMITQLKDSAYVALSRVLEDLLFGDPTERGIRRGVGYVKKLAVHLDRALYAEHLAARREVAKAKKKPA